eukprot:gb/GEZJ01003081.1/.p2 GENE.gb/GEZJ01003081.1/~~gb/GEZJ01003081.1/.p2  ORF type:complete len:110 (+),score=1.65 gb/GEZJ01003081.1/:818-1147(+)
MSSPYPTHIEVPVRYTPTAELSHSQLMKLYQLGIPVIEDLSWEDVSANSNVKLKEYSKLYVTLTFSRCTCRGSSTTAVSRRGGNILHCSATCPIHHSVFCLAPLASAEK